MNQLYCVGCSLFAFDHYDTQFLGIHIYSIMYGQFFIECERAYVPVIPHDTIVAVHFY